MKGTSARLVAHMSGDAMTLCVLWKARRGDGAILGFTDLDADVTYDDGSGDGPIVYHAASGGFTQSDIEDTSELAVNNVEVQGFLDSEAITDADLFAGLWDRVEIRLMRVNYMDLTMGHESLARGFTGEVVTGRNSFKTEMRSLTQALAQQTQQQVYATCLARFGDARCGVSLLANTFEGSVVSASSNQSFVTDLAQAAGYFAKGYLRWTSGLNMGLKQDIKFFGGAPNLEIATYTATITAGAITVPVPAGKSFTRDFGVVDSTGLTYTLSDTPSGAGTYEPQTGGLYSFNAADEGKSVTITYQMREVIAGLAGSMDLTLEMPYEIQPGDTFKAVRGCDKLFTTCVKTFANGLNFQGYPWLPGRDRLLSGES